MAGSISDARDVLAQIAPNITGALTWMVPAMEAAYRNAGKRSFLGKDKGQEAYGKFLGTLHTTIYALYQDRAVTTVESPAKVYEMLNQYLRMFAAAYPNWPDAYRFASEFFGPTASPVAAGVIQQVRDALIEMENAPPFLTRSPYK